MMSTLLLSASLSLAITSRRSRTASLQLLLLLLLRLVPGWRRLNASALHSFTLHARFIRLSRSSVRRYLLM